MDALQGNHRLNQAGIAVIRIGDGGYPPLLREIADPPQALYVRGNADALAHPLPIAVVGTRKMTPYGAAAARLIVVPLASGGISVVSGLALGIDAAAHAMALDAGGVTVAVLAGGVDPASVGPRTNAGLAERIIASGGALVSERPPGSRPSKMSFPRRNRIIAGLTRGTLVIEAAARSGSLITAYLALEAGRDVYAVPGPITASASAGANGLIRRGASPATCADDILAAYGLDRRPPVPSAGPRDGRERAILRLLEDGPRTADAVIAGSGLASRDAIAALAALVVAGFAAEDRGIYSKN
ncbi:MAG: DNA-protecting protein DprA [Candidatus Parcubacteria bacterium]|jgi:DNA processing protein